MKHVSVAVGEAAGLLYDGEERVHGDQVPLPPPPRRHCDHGLPQGISYSFYSYKVYTYIFILIMFILIFLKLNV